jgi:hypothetical protein
MDGVGTRSRQARSCVEGVELADLAPVSSLPRLEQKTGLLRTEYLWSVACRLALPGLLVVMSHACLE